MGENIRSEIQALIDRGNVTAKEVAELASNSWEWEALIPKMDDETFLGRVEHALKNCCRSKRRPFATYDESVIGLLAPELVRRLVEAIETGKEYERGAEIADRLIHDLEKELEELRRENKALKNSEALDG
jgi:hypothetical protein